MGRCAQWFVVAAIALACGNGAIAQEGTPRLFGQHTPASEDQLLEELSQSPDNAGARLALARLYFRENRDAAADFAARQALADAAAAGQTENVAQARDLLEALQRRRRWVFTADATIAPDTSREFLIPGETEDDPSTLLERDSGLGIEGFASLERRIPIGDDTLLSLQGFGRGEAFEEDDFNTLDVTLLAGPAFLLGGDDILRARALYQQRWFGGEAEFDAIGGEFSLAQSPTPRLRTFARLTVRDVDFDGETARDALAVSLDGDISRYGEAGRIERVFGILFYNDADAADQSFWFARLGAGAYREVPGAIGIYVEPSVAAQIFDGEDPIALEAREDTELRGLVRVSKRDWRVLSAAPFLSLEVSQLYSTIDRLEGVETAVQAGFTRSF
ncbi:MAG: surface lipoprotein assembly modifier [Pseudomonadota bacterium]